VQRPAYGLQTKRPQQSLDFLHKRPGGVQSHSFDLDSEDSEESEDLEQSEDLEDSEDLEEASEDLDDESLARSESPFMTTRFFVHLPA